MIHHLTLGINPGERVGISGDELPLLDENGSVIAACWQMGEDFDGDNDANMVAYAERIVACVNACAGIANFPSEGLKAAMLDSAIAWQKAINDRDEAIETVRELLAMIDGQMPLNTKRAYDVIKAAG